MKKIFLAAFCLTATGSFAQDADESEASDANSVDLRVSVIESIVVTAEKPLATQSEAADEDVAAILDEAEIAEEKQTAE